MCEDPLKVNYIKEATTQTQIDLRGPYRQPGRPVLDARRPSDLVAYGIRVPEHAIVATPTWGEEGLAEYKQAIEASETVVFDLSLRVEG